MSPVTEIPLDVEPSFHRLLGMHLGIGPANEGIAWVDVDPEKHFGTRWAHGGLVGTLADVASGVTVALALGSEAGAIDGTIELKVNFLRKVVDGDITATARVLHLGQRTAVTDVDVTNKGVLCAKAVATFMLRRTNGD